MTANEALRLGADRLRRAGIDNPRLEARLLLGHAMGLEQPALLADLAAVLAPECYLALIERRAAREPLAFLTGTREFWSLPVEVSPATLIPRPDSETLIEAALAVFPDRSRVRRILDLGTGTGCLLLAALMEFPASFGLGIDLEPRAAVLARRNATLLRLDGRAGFVIGRWAASISGGFDLVLGNPPYIRTAAIADLMTEVSCHEPRLALDGGPDGLDAYREIIPRLPGLLAPGGAAILEIGPDQEADVAALSAPAGLTTYSVADLAGIARAVVLRPLP